MKQYHSFGNFMMIALLCTAITGSTLLSGCSKQTNNGTEQSATSANGTASADAAEKTTDAVYSVAFDEEDTTDTYNTDEAVVISLQNDKTTVSGNGASFKDGTLTIDKAGTYLLSGTLSDGQIHITADKDALVRLILSNASVTSKSTAALQSDKCRKVVLLLQDGTQNSFADTQRTITEDSDEPDAAVYIKNDLTILGSGQLTVNGNAKNGLTAKDVLRISGGTITVNAENHAITGKDNLAVEGGILTVNAKNGDGLRTNQSDTSKTDLGHITIANADITITAANDAIQADKTLRIDSGTLKLTTGGGADMAPQASGSIGFGGRMTQNNTASEDTESRKGLKAGEAILISGGTLSADTYDDAIHSNGSAEISGGELTLRSGDDGIHADTTLSVTGGNTVIEKSYEGLEAIQVNISDGIVDITASDDGINAAGGNDNSGFGGFDGNMDFGGRRGNPFADENTTDQTDDQPTAQPTAVAESTLSGELNISGGTVCVQSGGDGLDSNAALNISGGTIILNGPTTGGNGIIDHDGTCSITGGLLIGAGTSDMLEMPGRASTQKTVAILFEQTQKAGTLVYISDSSGAIVAAMKPEVDFECLLLSSAALSDSETYTVYLGGTSSGDNTHGYLTKAAVSGGTAYSTFTAKDAVSYVNQNGNTDNGGFGGRGQAGNFRPGQSPDGNAADNEVSTSNGFRP